jgi:hypothetical protein
MDPKRGVPKRRNLGVSLLEVVISIAVIGVLVIVFVGALRVASTSMVQSRELIRRSRVAKHAYTQVKAMNFFELFSCDSSLPQYGLLAKADGGLHSRAYNGVNATSFADFKSSASLLAIQQTVEENGFDHFDLSVEHMRRDKTGSVTPGVVTNLVPFRDTLLTVDPLPPAALTNYTTGDGYDDWDAGIQYADWNSDGDYYDSWMVYFVDPPLAVLPPDTFIVPPAFMGVGGQVYALHSKDEIPVGSVFLNIVPSRIVEMPDTRLKRVTFRLWNRKKRLVSTEVWLISEKDITGETTDDMESALPLDVTNPLPGIYLFERMGIPQINALDLPINNSYAASNIAVRADAGQPLVFTGRTGPLASVFLSTAPYWTPGFILSVLDNGSADVMGAFSIPANNITLSLVEGANTLGGIAQNPASGALSPFWKVNVTYDRRAPVFDPGAEIPANNATVFTRTPFVGVRFFDDTASTSAVAGIARETVWVGTGPAAVSVSTTTGLYMDNWAVYNDSWVVVASTASGLIEPLPNGAWVYVTAEGGDRAGYKANKSWRFFVNSNPADMTPPDIDTINIAPGFPTEISCHIYDNQSGVDWRTVDLTVRDSALNVKARVNKVSTPRMADYFNPIAVPNGGKLIFRSTEAWSAGNYTATISADNFNGISFSTSPLFVVP